MLVPCEASVEHGFALKRASPSIGAAQVAPCVETLLAHDGAGGICYRRPRAKVVLVNIMKPVHAIFLLYNGEHAKRASKEGATRVVTVLRHKLAVVAVDFLSKNGIAVLLHYASALLVKSILVFDLA